MIPQADTPKFNGEDWHGPDPTDFWEHFDWAMVRERPEFIDDDGEEGIRLHLGYGKKFFRSRNILHDSAWEHIDYPEWDAESDGPRGKLPYDDDTVVEIACYHTLDHFTPEAVVGALREFQRVLAPGRAATIVVPHYSSILWNECLFHKSRFAIDTWRNIFSERQYSHTADGITEPWKLEIGFNMILGLAEKNTVLMTQLVKKDD